MKRTKKIALIILAVMLLAVCSVFGASAVSYEDYYNAGVADPETQTIVKFNLNGGTFTMPVMVYDFEIGDFVMKEPSEFTASVHYVVTWTSSEPTGRYITLPTLTYTDIEFYGWFCCEDNITYAPGARYKVPSGTEGRVIEFLPWTEPKKEFQEGLFTYKIEDEKAIIISIDRSDIEKLVIPDTLGGYEVVEIADYAINDAYTEFCVSESNKYFSVDESGALFNKDKTEIYAYPIMNRQRSYKIPDSVEIIGVNAFREACFLKNLELSVNLRIIEEQGIRSSWFALDEIYLSEKVEKLDNRAIYDMSFLKKIYIEGMNTELVGEEPIGFYEIAFSENAEKDHCSDLLFKYYIEGDESAVEEFNSYMGFPEKFISTIYCHAGSTAEAYANYYGMDCELIHFFKGEWAYDYENMIRTRKCIHCDEIETEILETTESGDVEIIEPSDPDTDFEVGEIEKNSDNYIIIDEALSGGVDGDYEILKAFDITLKNKDGVHVQPDGTVKVKLPLDWTKDGIYKVYRVNDDGTLTDMNAYRQGSHMVFDTDHFSIYVIVEESEKTDEEPDTPEKPDSSDCICICHKKGFIFEILTIVFRFVSKHLGVFSVCGCGIAHY